MTSNSSYNDNNEDSKIPEFLKITEEMFSYDFLHRETKMSFFRQAFNQDWFTYREWLKIEFRCFIFTSETG